MNLNCSDPDCPSNDALYETNWFRWNEQREQWEFNHRQPTWLPSQTEPNPVSLHQQKAWHGAQWKKERVLRESSST